MRPGGHHGRRQDRGHGHATRVAAEEPFAVPDPDYLRAAVRRQPVAAMARCRVERRRRGRLQPDRSLQPSRADSVRNHEVARPEGPATGGRASQTAHARRCVCGIDREETEGLIASERRKSVLAYRPNRVVSFRSREAGEESAPVVSRAQILAFAGDRRRRYLTLRFGMTRCIVPILTFIEAIDRGTVLTP